MKTPPARTPRSTPPPFPIDVIVPVYRGLADTRTCVESVLASSSRTSYRLVIINDASPEPELTAWLRQRAVGEERILLLENEINLGFVGTVNRGMALSALHDVVLLNSDTEVANDWLDRLQAAAYGDTRTASVTPFSTNATICSYPRFCQDNRMPAGWTTARLDALFARLHAGQVVDVPTGVGFCMYVRREALRELGLFDEARFGRGYGEENDFCQRAARAGWRNVHLLDTFVLHTGGVSFGDSKHPREQAALQTLQRLHPNYGRDVHAFVQADPARGARIATDIARISESGLPVVLAITHSRGGGTMRHVVELAQHLTGRASFLVLTPAGGRRVMLRLEDPAEAFELAFQLPEQKEGLLDVLRALGTRHVHFHHLHGHDRFVRELPHLLGVGHDFTVHDFYSYCSHISLTGKDDRYAGEPAPGLCGCCTPGMPGPDGFESVAAWREANARLLREARSVLVPSHDAATRIAPFEPRARVVVAGHTDMQAMPSAAPGPRAEAPREALRVVVLGALSRIKGADVLEAVALEAARQGAPIEFHLLGFGYRKFNPAALTHLQVHGPYEDGELPRLLQDLGADLAWFPAQWPETYSYTLSAAMQAGLPVLVPDLGAFSERVHGRPWSWIRPWNMAPADWLRELLDLRRRHFRTGIPPVPAECPSAPPRAAGRWNYRVDYLAGFPVPGTAGRQLTGADVVAYLPVRRMTARLKLRAVLSYLRNHPRLHGIVHGIPANWRRRVNDWLNA